MAPGNIGFDGINPDVNIIDAISGLNDIIIFGTEIMG
jgi:hypothetical protein